MSITVTQSVTPKDAIRCFYFYITRAYLAMLHK